MAARLKEELDQGGVTSYKAPTGTELYKFKGKLAKFMAKFFGDKIEPVEDLEKQGLLGDTIKNPESVRKNPQFPNLGATGSYDYITLSSEVELNRKRRYQEFDKMDDYPELAAAFDIYADDCTQKDTKNKRWKISSEDANVIVEVEKLFDVLKLHKYLWDIARNMVKYGDSFVELITNLEQPELGIQRLKVLSPEYMRRVENEYGYLEKFLQEIPTSNSYSYYTNNEQDFEFIELDKNQVVHFRILNSDPKYYPYGKSIAYSSIKIFKSLKLMEDAMMIYRLVRAPERRIFYIDVGNLPSTKADLYIEKIKEKFKKEKYYNTSTGVLDARMNPQTVEEDFYVPVRGAKGTKIETLQGAENLGEVDDVKYFRDKLLSALKIPKDFIVEQAAGAERKANLSQLDIKFARVIARMQLYLEEGLETIAKKHLILLGTDPEIVEALRVELPDPSDLVTKRKLDVDEQKARVVGAMKGLQLFADIDLLMEFWGLNEEEAQDILSRSEVQKQEEQDREMEMMIKSAEAAGPPGGGQPMGGQAPIGQPKLPRPPYGSAGGQESPKNDTKKNAKHEGLTALGKLKKSSISKENLIILERLEKRLSIPEKIEETK